MKFDIIKGRIQRFTLSSILENSFGRLKDVEINDSKTYPIWHVLILVKWAFQYTTNSPLRHRMSKQDFDGTIHLLEKFEYQNRVVSFQETKKVIKNFKILGFQQFWIQEKTTLYALTRQMLLFDLLPSSKDISKDFYDLSGMTIINFLKCAQYTYLYFFSTKYLKHLSFDGIIHEDFFEVAKDINGLDQIQTFIDLLTLKSKAQLESIQELKNPKYQIYETNFWWRYPFIPFRSKKMILHSSIIVQTCKNFIFNFIKESRSNDFTQEFGHRMEKYIGLGLNECKRDFVNESNLKKKLPLGSKCIDFLLEDTTLIESKGAVLRPRTGIQRNTDILKSDFKSSLVQAYKQIIATAHNLPDYTSGYFGIIVTYGETLISFGDEAWDDFLSGPISEFVLENSYNIQVVPPKNLLIVNLETWDRIILILKTHPNETIAHLITEANTKVSNKDISMFDQYLINEYENIEGDLTYLRDVEDRFSLAIK